MIPQLRFAPIIRVSTEQQEKQGESLLIQKAQIMQYVNSMHGVIPESCWQYSGQEHATPDQERKKLDRLLADSGKGIFDAVICADPSRWSRDNQKSKEGLNILRTNSIRFFVGTTEYDLFDPTQNLFLGMSAEIGEYQAHIQSLKSINSRVARCQRGVPATGYLPYGRTFNKVTETWGLDPIKHKLIQQAAKRYINGEGFGSIAPTIKMSPSQLWKILSERSGPEWTVRLRNKKGNVDETITMTIPALLDEDTINAIHERARINITYKKGNRKYEYLLCGFIFCSRCGLAMDGYNNSNGKRYHRHSRHGAKCFHNHIPATELENNVLIGLIQTFGDPERIERAIQRATPDLSRRSELDTEHTELTRELHTVISQKDNIVEAVMNGLLKQDEVRTKMDKLRTSEEAINARLQKIQSELISIPDLKQVKRSSLLASKVIADATRNNPQLIFKKSYEWKRKLIEKAFSGVNNTGQRLGVYVDYVGDHFTFEIRGAFDSTVSSFPMTDDQLMDAFHIDPDNQDNTELKDIKSHMVGEYHTNSCGGDCKGVQGVGLGYFGL